MMLLRSQSISHFNVKRTIWLKGCQNGQFFAMLIACSRCSDGSDYVVAVLITLKPDSTLNVEI